MHKNSIQERHRIDQRASLYRSKFPAFKAWTDGYGVVQHTDITQVRVFDLCQQLICQNRFSSLEKCLEIFVAADLLANLSMWLVGHMTYANRVDLDGNALAAADFKDNPQGHTGGSLNMVPAYVGYIVVNSLAGVTRSWVMGQGHCVAAIDSVNVMLGNLLSKQAARYKFDSAGLSKLVSDFYSYAIDEEGRTAAPLGSHVNPYTAGGILEGGYLGFAELQYVHMPLPGEHLIAFLSDGAFEEQRGSDWAPRWWRAEDCGLVTPVMIANGRRIDQRTTMQQQGGLDWLYDHLVLNGFFPMVLAGRDPAAFIWGVIEAESRLRACSEEILQGRMKYPVQLPYLIAETVKGFGFYGAGTNAAHGTPLPENPCIDEVSRNLFTQSVKALFVPSQHALESVAILNSHIADGRAQEKDNALSCRSVKLNKVPETAWVSVSEMASPMSAIDTQFCRLVKSNPELRVRVGNPDELSSNRMTDTLKTLKHRVLEPETGVDEALFGSIITALNEEAVVSSALGNKGGLNLVVSYEAFAVKMLGALRQEIIFARHQKEIGRPAKWLSVPVIAASHLWENGKNEQSHQDPLFGEALFNEMSDVARVVYPADANSAMACLNACYQTQGQIWAMTIPKQPMASGFNAEQAKELVSVGAISLTDRADASVQLVAVGGYQLGICRNDEKQLGELGINSQIVYMLEPGKFRAPRDEIEAEIQVDKSTKSRLFPNSYRLRVLVTHIHPEVILGVCRSLDFGSERCLAFGYRNRGGPLDTKGLFLVNS